ncbi:hypothetical protein C9J12_25545 [Photobacterium frigidiphilum]|uniref:Uncharacterized protein n=1 Tax=Photobacterium frigidiphilum TaxID=264736 RepID=A0A2T3J7N2_9GAMM|nr:hypothetical protein [Photobacterium frigidiphilum]PSU44765.1 hypothetical protein C9J12_25545 [Photobacterium frigidiphilum]
MSQTEEICNPELAEEFIARIFATLYESWPVRIGLDAQKITGIDYDVELLCGIPSVPVPREWSICSELFNWLKDEGYIKTDGFRGNVWTLGRTQLTHKAIEVLKKVPDPLNPEKKRSLIDAIVDSTKDSGKQVRNQVIKLAMTSLYQAIN